MDSQQIDECIVLAGGLGTRLQHLLPGIPKCIAPVNGKPFLTYVVDYLLQQGIRKFVFSLGYKYEVIQQVILDYYPRLNKQFCIEQKPLGTGGGILNCLSRLSGKHVFVVNGDTLFRTHFSSIAAQHFATGAQCTLALTYIEDCGRYGSVRIGNHHLVTGFAEKQPNTSGYINAGVYALQVEPFLQKQLPSVCSFEKDYLQIFYGENKMFGVPADGYFIDIGIPKDYERAQKEFAQFCN